MKETTLKTADVLMMFFPGSIHISVSLMTFENLMFLSPAFLNAALMSSTVIINSRSNPSIINNAENAKKGPIRKSIIRAILFAPFLFNGLEYEIVQARVPHGKPVMSYKLSGLFFAIGTRCDHYIGAG